jgi:hypothetical protein
MIDAPLNRSLSRKGLLRLGVAAALGIGAMPAARAATGAPSGEKRSRILGPRYLRLSSYEPLEGDTFRISRPRRGRLAVKLVAVQRLAGDGEAFSLLFRARGNAKIGQGTFQFEHAGLGEFPLFLVPVGRAIRGQNLQVIVNRVPHPLG